MPNSSTSLSSPHRFGTNAPVVRVFGSLRVEHNGVSVNIGGPLQRRLLALLVIRPDTLADHDWLAEYLWTDHTRPAKPGASLRTALSRLRTAMPEAAREWIITEPPGYRWVGPTEAVDYLWAADARRHAKQFEDPLQAYDLLTNVLDECRGEPFREIDDLIWARPHIEQITVDRFETMEDRWEVALALDRHTDIIGELAAFTSENNLRDRAARQLALALYRSNRSTEALREIARHRRNLAEASGLDPSPELAELERAILAGDRPVTTEPALRQLRGYRLLEQAGTGAFALVWRGYQVSVNRQVAIKQIRQDLASQPEFIRRFEAEAQIVARLEHPAIVPLIDYWREPDSAYLVMRWLPGGTLIDRLADGPLPLATTMRIVQQVGSALEFAHGVGVAHGDVSAGNVLFDDLGHGYLSDFGIASDANVGLRNGTTEARQTDISQLAMLALQCLTGATAPDDLRDPGADGLTGRLGQWTGAPESVRSAIGCAIGDTGEGFGSVGEFLDALAANPEPLLDATGHSAPGETPSTTGWEHREDRAQVRNPYNGLRAFHSADAPRFFGRESLIAELVQQIGTSESTPTRTPGVVVVGPSGSGKSSLVRAGLVPALQAGAAPGSSTWFTTTMTPGPRPFEALEAAVLRIAVNPPERLLDQLRDGPRGIIRGIRRCLASDDDVLVVVIDQFEELFTATADHADASDFLDGIAAAVDEPNSPLRLVATLRADFYSEPLEHSSFAPILKRCTVAVTPLSPEEMERAIVRPVEHLNIGFEPGLVPRIVAEATGQPSPLPLLQYVLSELFERRTRSTLSIASYEEIGGLSGALTARADSLFLDADALQQQVIRRVFGALTNPRADAHDLRRRVPVGDLGTDAPDIIDRFGDARLLTFDRDPATRAPTVEVAHEALLREWPRLNEWIRKDGALLRAVDELASAADRWEAGGHNDADLLRSVRLNAASEVAAADNQRLRRVDREFLDASQQAADAERRSELTRIRRLTMLVAALAAVALIALAAGGFALVERNRAQSATEAAVVAELATRAGATDDPDLALNLALQAYGKRRTVQSVDAVLNAVVDGQLHRRVAWRPPLVEDDDCTFGFLNHLIGVGSEFGVVSGRMVMRDVRSNETTQLGTAPAGCVTWFGDPSSDRRVALADDGRAWFGLFDGDWTVNKRFDAEHRCPALGCRFTDSHRLLLLNVAGTGTSAVIVDDRTGEYLLPPLVDAVDVRFGIMDAIGRYAVLALTDSVVVVDAETGDMLSRFEDAAVSALAFGPDDELFATTETGQVLGLDFVAGRVSTSVKSLVASSPQLGVTTLHVRADGRVLVGGGDEIELVDPLVGPVDSPVVLPTVSSSEFLDDGTVFAHTTGGAVALYDLDANLLAEHSIDVGGQSITGVNEFAALALTREPWSYSLVNLPSGTSRALDPPDLSDDTVRFVTAGPTSGGDQIIVSVIGAGRPSLIRLIDGRIDDQFDLPGDKGLPLAKSYVEFYDTLARRIFAPSVVDGQLIVSIVTIGTEAEPSLELVATVPVDATSDRPMHVLSGDGQGGFTVVFADGAVQSFDEFGVATQTSNIEEGLGFPVAARVTPSGRLVMPHGDTGLLIADPNDGEAFETVPIDQLAFVLGDAGGERALLSLRDGSTRLLAVDDAELDRMIWPTSDLGFAGAADTENDLVWVPDDGRLLGLPLDEATLIERACQLVPPPADEEAVPLAACASASGK